MSAHEDDASRPCEHCGVTFDIHDQLGCKPPMCYAGVKSCGCIVAAIVIDDEQKKRTAKDVGEWIISGMTVELRSVEYVRDNIHRCTHGAA